MEPENPYAGPSVQFADPMQFEVPEEIRKKIKNGWVAAIISAAFTLVITLLAMSRAGSVGAAPLELASIQLVDVALLLGLAFGVYKKSRTCAVLLLIYFVASKIIIAMEGGKAGGTIMGLVFIYFYGQAVVGTFAYHKLKKRQDP
jgi:hypothetical protein